MTICFYLACTTRFGSWRIEISKASGTVQNFCWKMSEQGKCFASNVFVFGIKELLCLCLYCTVIQRMLNRLVMVGMDMDMKLILKDTAATHSDSPKRNWNYSIELHKLLRNWIKMQLFLVIKKKFCEIIYNLYLKTKSYWFSLKSQLIRKCR